MHILKSLFKNTNQIQQTIIHYTVMKAYKIVLKLAYLDLSHDINCV